MLRMKVSLINKKVFYSQPTNENDEGMNGVIDNIKNIGDMSFFWMIDKNKNVVSFNVNSIAAIEVLPVKKYWLF